MAEKVYSDFINNRINTEDALSLLSTILEESNDVQVRLKCVDYLSKFEGIVPKLLHLLENLIISDESELVRAKAIKIFYKRFIEYTSEPLKWSIKNDNSSHILKTHKNIIQNNIESKFKKLHIIWIKRVENIAYNLRLELMELNFLIDLGINFELNKSFNTDSYIGVESDNNLFYEVRKKHIITLNVSLICNFPLSVRNLTFLEHLDLSFNYLKNLPSEFKNLNNLKYLDLSWNEFSYFPNAIQELEFNKAFELLINHNKINTIPGWLTNFKKLKYLSINNNNIREISENFDKLSSLEFLDISHNLIKYIPESIFKLKKLKILNIKNNPITNLKPPIKQTSNLKIII